MCVVCVYMDMCIWICADWFVYGFICVNVYMYAYLCVYIICMCVWVNGLMDGFVCL